jgi:hypothetical protein
VSIRARSGGTPRPRMVRLAVVAGCVLAICLMTAGIAHAQDTGSSSHDEQIVLSGRLLVAEGETVDAAVIFNGPATIDGRVVESVVVFNGDAVVSGTVEGDVVVFNGSTLVTSGATIRGNLITVDAPTVEPGATVEGEQRRVTARFDAASFGFASRIAWWLAYTFSTLLLGLALLGFAPGLDRALPEASRTQTGAAIGFGAAAFFLLPVVAALLVAIVVAIPLGVFLLLALALLYTIGYVAAAHVLGRRLVAAPKSRFVAFLAGWGILRLIALIPLIGGIAWITATVFGLGVLLVAARRARSAPPASQVPAMPPPMPQPTP